MSGRKKYRNQDEDEPPDDARAAPSLDDDAPCHGVDGVRVTGGPMPLLIAAPALRFHRFDDGHDRHHAHRQGVTDAHVLERIPELAGLERDDVDRAAAQLIAVA
jgi:hypothetical protein